MIKANELRIGNIISKHFEDGDGSIEVVTTRTIFDCQVNPTGKFSYSGILLTPEILEKCGFKKRRDEEYLFSIDLDKHISIVVNKDNFFPMLLQDAEFSGGELNVYSCNLINYLHQLQNLYFALTGEELELKL